MSSSPRNEPHETPRERTAVLVGDVVAPPSAPSRRDPFEELDDLMVVVEALCPRWPEREGFGPMDQMLL